MSPLGCEDLSFVYVLEPLTQRASLGKLCLREATDSKATATGSFPRDRETRVLRKMSVQLLTPAASAEEWERGRAQRAAGRGRFLDRWAKWAMVWEVRSRFTATAQNVGACVCLHLYVHVYTSVCVCVCVLVHASTHTCVLCSLHSSPAYLYNNHKSTS